MAKYVNEKNNREVMYCPEESDWESYVKYHDVNYDWFDIVAVRRARKKAGLCPDCNKNVPIYNHKFLKIPNLNASLYNNDQSISNDLPSPKKILYKMEETYWSNWKPNRNRSPKRITRGRQKPQKEDREFHSDEDPGQQLIDYFAKTNLSMGSVSVDEHSIAKSEIIKNKDNKKNNSPFPLILEEKKTTNVEEPVHVSFSQITQGNKTYSLPSDDGHITTTSLTGQPSHITIPADSENGSTTKLKTFKHMDSFVIAKNKKREGKHYQQPKSIKLYKKSVKGGSYPGRKESNNKGNFRLGAPGSPILVTRSSFGGSGNGKRGILV